MFRIFASILVALAFASCKSNTTPVSVCSVAATSVSVGISATLNCQNQAAIAADLTAYMQSKGVCTATVASGTIGNLVCPMIGQYIISFANGSIPAAWQCNLGSSPFPVQATIVSLCEKAVTL